MREARFSIDDSDLSALGIGDLLDLVDGAGLHSLEELACDGNSAVVTVEVERGLDRTALDDLQYVDNWEHVSGSGETEVYLIAFTAPDLPDRVSEAADDLVGTCDPTPVGEGFTVSLTGPQEAIADTVDVYQTQGARPELRKLGAYEPDGDPVDALTDRQETVIRRAFEMGYYEVPRQTSTEEIAGDLGLDPSTVTEHLQRSERNLLAGLLGP